MENGSRAALAAMALASVMGLSGAQAAIVYVTYTGTVTSGYDDTGVFGTPGADLTGEAYTSNYVFDTSVAAYSYSDPSSSYYLVSGGGAYGTVSPSLGATLTINGNSVSTTGDYSGKILRGGNGSNSQVYHEALGIHYNEGNDGTVLDYGYIYELFTYNDVSTLPSDLITPFSHSFVPGEDGSVGYFLFFLDDSSVEALIEYAYGNLAPETFTISGIAAVPEPSAFALLLTGLAASGFAARRNRRRQPPA